MPAMLRGARAPRATPAAPPPGRATLTTTTTLARSAAGAAAVPPPLPPPAPRAAAKKATATPPTARRPSAARPPIQRDFAGGTGAARPWPDTLRVDKGSDVSGAAGALAKALRAVQQQQGPARGGASAAAAPTPSSSIIAPAPAAARPPVVRLWARDRASAWRALAALSLADRMLRQTDGRMVVFQPTVVTRGADDDEQEEQAAAAAAAAAQRRQRGRGGAAAAAAAAAAAPSGPRPGEYAFFVATLPAGEVVADNILTATGGARGEEAAKEDEEKKPEQEEEAQAPAEAAAEAAAEPASAPAPRAPRRPDGLAGDGGPAAAEQARSLSRAVMARVLGRGHTALEARGARAAAVALDAAIGARRGLLVRARDAAVVFGGQQQQQQQQAEGKDGPKLMRMVVVECAPRDVTAIRLRAAGEGGGGAAAAPAATVRRS
jgi:hypothetical protein